MPISQQISEAFVKISARGLEQVKAQFAALSTFTAKAKAQLEATAKSCNVVGSAAKTQFNSASSAMLRFAAAASPGDAMKLDAAYGRLTVQIGSLFLPVIRSATTFVEKLTDRLRALTPEQREQYGQFAKLGLVIAGVVGAGSTLLNFLPGLVSGIGAVGTAVKSLVSLIGLGSIAATGWGAVILAVVAGLGALAAVSVIAAGKTESIGKSFTKAWESIKGLAEGIWTAIKPILAAVGNVVAGVMSRVADVVGKVTGFMGQVWGVVGGIVAEIAPLVEAVATEVMSLADDLMDALAPVADWFANTLKDALTDLLPVIKTVLGGMVQFIRDAVRELRVMGRVLSALANDPTAALDLEGTVRTARMEVDRTDRERAAKREDEKNNTKSATKPTAAGVASVYKPELSSISDVLRKAQTAGLGESREMAMHRERIELQKQAIQKQGETTDAVRGLNIGLG